MYVPATNQVVNFGYYFLPLISNYASCPSISNGHNTGTVTDPEINEASGLVASQKNRGVFWTMNDSYGPHCIYAINEQGRTLAKHCLDGAANVDWEAIATAPCTKGSSEMCIFVGDVGDGPNPPHRDEIILYKVKEPTVHAYQKMTVSTTLGWTRYHYKYPDYARDCESILIDAEHREFIVVTKSENHGKVFKAPLDVPEHTYDNKLTYTGIYLNGLNLATDASTSADGTVVIVRMYNKAFMWYKNGKQSIVDAMRESHCLVETGYQKQGESIALNPEGTAYYVHSEHTNQPITRFDIN